MLNWVWAGLFQARHGSPGAVDKKGHIRCLNMLSLVVCSQQKSSDKSLVTFQSLSSCCSVDLYFSRLKVTGRGTDTCEHREGLNSYPKLVVSSKDCPYKQHPSTEAKVCRSLSFITAPSLSLSQKFTVVQGPSQELLNHLLERPLFLPVPTPAGFWWSPWSALWDVLISWHCFCP